MKTLFEIVHDSRLSDEMTQVEAAIRAAYWAGCERGRGTESRAIHEALRLADAGAEGQRYHGVYRSALRPIMETVSAPRDDAPEILSRDFDLSPWAAPVADRDPRTPPPETE